MHETDNESSQSDHETVDPNTPSHIDDFINYDQGRRNSEQGYIGAAKPALVDFDKLIENIAVVDTLHSTDTWRTFTALPEHVQFGIGTGVDMLDPEFAPAEFAPASYLDIPTLIGMLTNGSRAPVTLRI